MPQPRAHLDPQVRNLRPIGPIVSVLIITVLIAFFIPLMLSIGNGGPLIARVESVILIILNSAWIPIFYLLGSMGLGRIVRPWLRDLPTRWIIELGIGFTLTLTISHGLGAFGILNTTSAWIVTGLGCILFIHDRITYTTRIKEQRLSVLTLPRVVFALGCALLIVMSCNPPGALWNSEFGGYDALSYHLQLPREWFEIGHISPNEHNVYSFLPSYIESAYVHFAYLADSPTTTPDNLSGLLAHDGQVAMSTQLFSALLAIFSACAMSSLIKRATTLFIPDAHDNTQTPASLASLASALTITLPWIVVVGSLAYNEMGVVLLGVCALAVVIETNITPTKRAVLAAFLVAGACSCKPTALFLLAPSIAIIFLSTIPARSWIKPIIVGSFVGFLTLAPWLIRNQLASGNIVFPQLASALGQGHWTPDQHALYASAHHYNGSFFDRISLILFPDQTGTSHVSRFRGLTNMQWGIVPLIGLLGCMALFFQSRTHKLGFVLILALITPIIAWMMLTHLQSRFLILFAPLLIGAGTLALYTTSNRWIVTRLSNALSLGTLMWMIFIVSIQSASSPFNIIDLGSGVFTGEIQLDEAPWTATLNTITQPSETIYLIGDATPFYVRSPVIYNTVYDRWIILDAIADHPDDPTQWTQTLIDMNIDVVVISFSEIDRFAQSDWLPPSILPDQLIEWINTLSDPIYVWTNAPSNQPIRAAFRISR